MGTRFYFTPFNFNATTFLESGKFSSINKIFSMKKQSLEKFHFPFP